MAAPTATTSSGLTPLWGSLPKNSFTICWTFGMRVEPPTRTTSSICVRLEPRVLQAWRTGRMRLLEQVAHELLELRARELQGAGASGPAASAVMKGRLISVCSVVRQLALGLLRGLLEALERHRVLRRGRCPGPS